MTLNATLLSYEIGIIINPQICSKEYNGIHDSGLKTVMYYTNIRW